MAFSFARWGNDLYTGKKNYNIVGHRKYFYAVAIVAMILSIVIMFAKGFNLGIEFSGGSEFTISKVADTSQQPAIDAVKKASGSEPKVTVVGNNSLRVQAKLDNTNENTSMDSTAVESVRQELADAYNVPVEQVTYSFIGPSWGADVSQKALTGLIVFICLLIVTMTLYFRNWRMAIAAVLALFHDLIVTVGLYALIGWEVTPATVIGFLTILGYSIYDTVVVFDKVRENTTDILDQTRSTYSERANLAINQTLVRSINTSVVALLPVSSILFVGAFVLRAGTLRDIALALFIGMSVGAYSSIFLATPLEVSFREREKPIVEHTAKVLERREKFVAEHSELEPEEAARLALAAGSAHVRPGAHQGVTAQPRRRPSK